MKIFLCAAGLTEHTWVPWRACGPPSRFHSSLLKLDPAPGGGGGVLPLPAQNASESLMSASTALLTLLGQNTCGLYTVLKSCLHNVVMTSFAVMQLCPEAIGLSEKS